ncbi:hypothetical protein BY458DRAFT_3653 [Sporodiniella umbellata]|nr:hypothetical protein BY458DRAFT_3653 [Sporodiniella umbellata]
MSSGLRDCLERLHLGDNKRVFSQSERHLAKLNSLAGKALNKGPNCKPVVAIQLACEDLQLYDWNLNLAAQLAGCSVKAYGEVLSAARKQLDIQPAIAMNTLVTALGSTTMLSFAESLWAEFEERYRASLTGEKKNNVDEELRLSCWKGAIVFCCAKAFSDKLSKDSLCRLCSCSQKELNACIKIVESTCSKKLGEMKEDSRTPKRKRAKETEVSGETSRPKRKFNPVSGISSMVDQRDYTTTKKYKDYKVWHKTMIEQLEQYR